MRILDADPVQKLAKTSFFCTKFLLNLFFKHEKAAFPQLRDLGPTLSLILYSLCLGLTVGLRDWGWGVGAIPITGHWAQ
jgi:hypothetical protein